MVEASWRLGERPLKLTAPNLRGDDVSTLQRQLGVLGFDCGRVDGIFGPSTANALANFQRDCGLDADSICGPATTRAIEVNSAHTGTGPGVATLRELESLTHVASSLRDLRIVIGQFGGMGSITRIVGRDLRAHGSKVITVDELDPSRHAAAANRHGATIYLGFEAHAEPMARLSYYSTAGFTSAGGRSLASRLRHALGPIDELPAVNVAGMRLPVLRETRMTAVVCSLGPVQRATDSAAAIAAATMVALETWAINPTVGVVSDDELDLTPASGSITPTTA